MRKHWLRGILLGVSLALLVEAAYGYSPRSARGN